MESAVKQRLVSFIGYLGISKNAFEVACGLSKRYVSNISVSISPSVIEKISLKFPQLNKSWLLTGEGEMLKSTPTVQQNNTHGDNNGIMQMRCQECGSEVEIIKAEEVRRPIIPTEWTYQTDIDIFEKVQTHHACVSLSRFIALDVPIDMWHIVRDDSLLPDCKRGDHLALNAYPIGKENPIPGKIHAVDTKSNGMIIRILEEAEYGYRGIAPNSQRYPEMKIRKDDIIRVFRIVCMVRVAV